MIRGLWVFYESILLSLLFELSVDVYSSGECAKTIGNGEITETGSLGAAMCWLWFSLGRCEGIGVM